MTVLADTIRDKFLPITPEEAKSALADNGAWADDPALRLVCGDAIRAETWQQTKDFIMGWNSASTLYQSPFTQQYWPGTQVEAANVPMYTVATAVNSLNPQIMKGLFPGPNWFEIEERPGTRKQAARAIGAVIKYQMEDIGFSEELRLGSVNALLAGTAIFAYGWETFTKERTVFKRKRAPVVINNPLGPATGAAPITIHDTDEDIEEETITEYVDRPTFEHIVNLREILVAPSLNVPDIQKAKYVIRRQYLTWTSSGSAPTSTSPREQSCSSYSSLPRRKRLPPRRSWARATHSGTDEHSHGGRTIPSTRSSSRWRF